MADRQIEFLLTARDQASRVFERAGNTAQATGSRLSGIGKGVAALGAGAAIGGVVALGGALKGLYQGGQEGARVMRVLESQIGNLGPTGKAAFSGASDFAEKLAVQIGGDDDAIRQVQAKLASFPDAFKAGSLGAEAMRRATTAAFDLQAIGIGSAESNIIGIGKALNDPIKGMNALAKSGVSFSEQQKQQIKAAVAQGDLAKAQGILLAGIESNAKGAASASASSVDKLNAKLGIMRGSIEDALVPAVDKMAGWAVTQLPKLDRVFKAFGAGISAVGNWIRSNVWPALQRLGDAIMPKLRSAAESVNRTLSENRATIDKVRAVFSVLGLVITGVIVPILGKIVGLVISGIGPAFKGLVLIVDRILLPALSAIGTIFLNAVGLIISGAARAFGWIPGIGPKLRAAEAEFGQFRDKVNAILSGIHDKTINVRINEKTVRIIERRDGTVSVGGNRAVMARARGGPVRAGWPYVVGEEGLELFVPGQNGYVVPHDKLLGAAKSGGALGGGGASTTVVVNVHNAVIGRNQEIARAVVGALEEAVRSGLLPAALSPRRA